MEVLDRKLISVGVRIKLVKVFGDFFGDSDFPEDE